MKPFTCSECASPSPRRPTSWSTTGEKPYPCLEFGKWFSIYQSLVQHQKIHSGVKLFTCLIAASPSPGRLTSWSTSAFTQKRSPTCAWSAGNSSASIRAWSFTRETLLVLRMWQMLCPQSHLDIHRQETIHLHGVWQELQPPSEPLPATKSPHNGERPFFCAQCSVTHWGKRKSGRFSFSTRRSRESLMQLSSLLRLLLLLAPVLEGGQEL